MGYTKESGVRQLEREVAALCRKAAMQLAEGKHKRVSVNGDTLTAMMGTVKYQPEKLEREPQVGLVNGLAWTSVGASCWRSRPAPWKGTERSRLPAIWAM